MKRNTVFGRFPAEPSDARERARLEALDRLDIMDTPHEQAFDNIANLIIKIFNVDMSVVSFIDAHRQWYKASCGLGAESVARKDSFCKFTVEGSEPIVIRDAKLDPRFADHPAVLGPPYVRFYAGVPLRTREGHTVGTVCAIGAEPRYFSVEEEQILLRLTDLAMSFFELNQVAVTDSLTGALTRRAFKSESSRLVSSAARQKTSLACVALDLDHFKSVNDTFGHAAGDEVLVRVAGAIRSHLRESDVMGRLGGEEFAVILPHTDKNGALEVAEKLRIAIEKLPFTFGGEARRVTASFGVTAMSLVSKDIETILANADTALYRAKAEGRNCCRTLEASTPDGRSVQRRVLKAGQIIFNDRRSTMDCTIKAIGEQGASLEVFTSTGIPDKFTLTIRSDSFETECRVVSINERFVDVRFCQ